MNNIVIIGNGFDLAHHIETSYNHFITWYLNNAVKNARLGNSGIYEDILVKIIIDFAYCSSEPIKSFDIFKNNYLDNSKYFKIEYKSNLFEKIIKDSFDKNWIDIESAFYEELKYVSVNYSKSRNSYFLNSLNSLNTQFDFIKNQLIIYLNGIDKKPDSKIPKLTSIFDDIINTNNSVTTFVNFNYTDTLCRYISVNNRKIEIINIHGELDKTKLNPIIFGYGDETDKYYQEIIDFNINNFLNHFKSFYYFKKNNYRRLMGKLNLYYNVFIFGHSCGISDKVLLNTIFDNSKCNSIKIYYYKKSENSDDFFERTQEISRHFKLENRSDMRRKIVPLEESIPLPNIIE